MENMLPYLNGANSKDIIDMDTLERIRSVSESSMGGTSGYNTTSPGPSNSPNSASYSPVQSPDTVLQTEFSNLVIPPISYQQNSPQYAQLQNVNLNSSNNNNQTTLYQQNQNSDMNFSPNLNFGNPLNYQQFQQPTSYAGVKYEYQAKLRITEQPVEKFRFRYKSEMHGTHGSLNGTNSQRNTKSFPEVELCGYKGPAIIRCSLFQTNLDSPHSHQLVVRKDDHDICDPHELKVCQEVGYFAEFKNMGIIHTAKKFIVEELLKKKRKRLLFELGRDVLTTKEEQELYKQTEKEAKDMNLNQVRLCFEAFRVEGNNTYTPIAAPMYSNPINNRKSAQTGELRITRLSLATGSVAGGNDLILLVEKVSKKNIKVRFYEMVDDEQVWEAFASFRESDVHHQYAIMCRTPAYKNKNIDEPVDVYIELVRPSDDERSYPPLLFRYKPSDAAISRKRRRTCSSLTGSWSSNSGEIPKTIQDNNQLSSLKCTSEEINRLLNDSDLNKSNDLSASFYNILDYLEGDTKIDSNIPSNIVGRTERDGACANSDAAKKSAYHYKKLMISKKQMDIAKMPEQREQQPQPLNRYLQRILNIFNDTRSATAQNPIKLESAAEQINKIFYEHLEKDGESLIHEIVLTDNNKLAIPIFRILEYFKLNDLLNTLVNKRRQTSLHYACLYGQSNYIRPLLKLGCKPNLQDSEGNTALHIAVREKHLKCVESFINSEMTLNLNMINDDGFTPLHLAIRDNNYDIASKLLKYDGTIVDVPTSKDGNNALHLVIQQQNIKLVRLVLDNQFIGSILYAINTAGHTALDLAKQLVFSDVQEKEILNLLLTYYNKYPSPEHKLTSMDVNVVNEANDEDDDEEEDDKLVIKEEDISCSSTEDDEDSGCRPITKTPLSIIDESEIKQEFPDGAAASATAEYVPLSTNDLETALNDKDIFTRLSIELNKNERWKQLANKLEMQHFYLSNAEGFLNSLKRALKTINCVQFTTALRNVDKNLITLIRNE